MTRTTAPFVESSTMNGMMSLSRHCWNMLGRYRLVSAHHAGNALVLPQRTMKNTEHRR